jgi:carboxyl-terminal processing protease
LKKVPTVWLSYKNAHFFILAFPLITKLLNRLCGAIRAPFLQLGRHTHYKPILSYMQSIKHLFPAVLVLAAGTLYSCKKADVAPVNQLAPAPTTPASPVSASYKDTAVAYSRDIYLWNEQIPASFSGSSFTNLSAMMTSLRQYSLETGFSGPVDKWSFAVTRNEWDGVSSGTASGDFGMGVFFRSATDLRVKHVEVESPAGRAGVRRGWRILKINGSENFSTSNTAPVVQAVFESNSSQFTFERPG